MFKKYIVTLESEEREMLKRIVSSGKGAARKLRRSRILLKSDSGPQGPAWSDRQISDALDVSTRTIETVRREFVEEGFDVALERRKPRRDYRRKLDGEGEAHLLALACSKAPKGHARWSLRLLADKLVVLEVVDGISHEAVRRVLKKHSQTLAQ